MKTGKHNKTYKEDFQVLYFLLRKMNYPHKMILDDLKEFYKIKETTK